VSLSLLEIVQQVCGRMGLPRPATVASSQDDSTIQMMALLNEVVMDLVTRGKSWKELQRLATFTSVAAEQQGLMTTIAPYGFQYIIEDTIFDRTQRRPLFGPRGAPAWQQSEALPYTGPEYTYRIWQGYFMMQPAPPAGREIAFEYASNWPVQAANGEWKKFFDADDDTCPLDDTLLLLGLRWKWKSEKGLPYAQEKTDFESAMAQFSGQDSTHGEISMSDQARNSLRPGIWVPAGNWNV
jgi:hypothetical protein